MTDKLLEDILKRAAERIPEKMSEDEFQRTLDMFKYTHDDDIERLIVHLQYIRQVRKRKFESTKQYNFCDKCQRTYPSVIDECLECGKSTRTLPIYVDFAYLIDGKENWDKNPYFYEVSKLLK